MDTHFPFLPQIRTSNAVQLAFVGVLGACTWALGLPAMIKLYFLPYIVSVMWLDLVTYLHHHGPSNPEEEMPWYRGEVSHGPGVGGRWGPVVECDLEERWTGVVADCFADAGDRLPFFFCTHYTL